MNNTVTPPSFRVVMARKPTPEWAKRGVPPEYAIYAEQPQIAFPLTEGVPVRNGKVVENAA